MLSLFSQTNDFTGDSGKNMGRVYITERNGCQRRKPDGSQLLMGNGGFLQPAALQLFFPSFCNWLHQADASVVLVFALHSVLQDLYRAKLTPMLHSFCSTPFKYGLRTTMKMEH